MSLSPAGAFGRDAQPATLRRRDSAANLLPCPATRFLSYGRFTAPPPVRLVGRNARGTLHHHQRTNAPGAMQIDATDADEAVASAAVAYPHHDGCRTDVRRLIAVRRWTVSS
jgi:hypothetical protein